MEWEPLPGGQEFSCVFDDGKARAGRYVVLQYLKKDCGPVRCGFAAGKRLGNAVLRNRLRRRLREALRTSRCKLMPSDIILIARKKTADVKFPKLKKEIRSLLHQAGLLYESEGISSEVVEKRKDE